MDLKIIFRFDQLLNFPFLASSTLVVVKIAKVKGVLVCCFASEFWRSDGWWTGCFGGVGLGDAWRGC